MQVNGPAAPTGGRASVAGGRYRLTAIAFFLFSGVWLMAQEWPGKASVWHGFERYDFSRNDHGCTVVVPTHPRPGRPWVWRARFWGHEPQADIALLNKGYHVVYSDVAGLFGGDRAVKLWDAFHAYLTTEHGLAPRAVLEGMSRGGLIVLNWAAANPDKVDCMYLDAPVCDLRSWPGGKGTGRGAPAEWERSKKVYGLTEEQALAYDRQPLDRLASLAAARIPILVVYGSADDVVPPAENCEKLAETYRTLGGVVELIPKAGVGHHPHSLEDPTPIVVFIIDHTARSVQP